MTTSSRSSHGLRVAVEAEDTRVAAGLRQLVSSDPGVTVTDPAGPTGPDDVDVVVVELAASAGPEAGIRIAELAHRRPVVVLGFDGEVRRAVGGLPDVVFLDKLDAGSRLLVALHELAGRRVAPSAWASWPRVAVVVAAVFAGPWAFWLTAIAQDRGLIGWRLPQGLALWSMVPLLVGAVAATSGRPGLRDLGARLTRFRAPVRTYAAAAGLPLLIAGVTAAVVTLGGRTVPYGQLLSLPAALLYLGYGTGLFLLTEEAAWRGTLLPRVQDRLGAAPASLVLGLVWAGWHLPLLATPGEADQGLPLVPFVLLIVATSVLITALVNAAGGSVVVAALFHASFDACYSWFGVVGDEHAMLWTATTVTALAAAGLLAATRGRLCRPPGADREPLSADTRASRSARTRTWTVA